VKSRTTKQFKQLLRALPKRVQQQARYAFRMFLKNPNHPGLRFKPVGGDPVIYSARIGKKYRALATVDAGDFAWYWIGSHGDYDKFVKLQ